MNWWSRTYSMINVINIITFDSHSDTWQRIQLYRLILNTRSTLLRIHPASNASNLSTYSAFERRDVENSTTSTSGNEEQASFSNFCCHHQSGIIHFLSRSFVFLTPAICPFQHTEESLHTSELVDCLHQGHYWSPYPVAVSNLPWHSWLLNRLWRLVSLSSKIW